LGQTCAVSCTGDGEYFIRAVAAYDVSCLVAYKGLSLRDACQYVIMDKLKKLDGEGGLIAVDPAGRVELVFNSTSMFRAWRNDRGEGETAIF
jgi:beta-aspartyl-peptidase (threonine type)